MELARSVALRDVHDVVGFVAAVVYGLPLTLGVSEREELEAEGVVILYQLAEDWDGRGTFYGFASSRIDKRLLSAHCKMGGCSRQRVYGKDGTWTGERRWVKPTVSLDAELERPSFSEAHIKRLGEFRRVPVAA